MSVLIKDMKMPRSCYNCKLDLRTDVCSAFLEWDKEHPYSIKSDDRLPNCPLVEVTEQHNYGEMALSEQNVPSAQPEIIRCKECIHNRNCDIQYHALAGDLFYCGAAERRTDDEGRSN